MSMSPGEFARRITEYNKAFDLATSEKLAASSLSPFEGHGRRMIQRMRTQNSITKQGDGRFRRGKGISETVKKRSLQVFVAQAEANQLKQARARRQGQRLNRQTQDSMVDVWRWYDVVAA